MKEIKKKILVIAVQFYPETSGYSFAATNFVKSIAKDYDVTVMAPVTKKEAIPEIDGIKVKRGCKQGIMKYFYQFKVLPYILKNLNNFDVIFFDTAEMFLLGNIITRMAPAKTIVRFHGCMTTEAAFFSNKPMLKVWKFFISKWIKKSRILTMTTPYYIDFINQNYLKSNLYLSAKKNYAVIPNTIFIEDYKLLNKQTVFEKFNITVNNFNMLTLGRMDENGLIQKGIEDVLFAIHRLKSKHDKNNFSLLVIGNGSKKIYLEQLAKKLNLTENINFIEEAEHIEVLSLSKYLDATILFSRFEGMSMFGLESISLGCFPIFSNVGGLKDLVKDNHSGFLVEPQNISELTTTILKTMEMDRNKREEYRINSINHFQNNFTPEIIADKFSDAMDYIQ